MFLKRPLDVEYEKMIAVFNRDHHAGPDPQGPEEVENVFDDEKLEERRLRSVSRSSRRRKRRRKQKLQDQTQLPEDLQSQQTLRNMQLKKIAKERHLMMSHFPCGLAVEMLRMILPSWLAMMMSMMWENRSIMMMLKWTSWSS